MADARPETPAIETVPAKTIVTRNKDTRWFGCEYNMNLYRGCNHGCIYCDSRSDCYHLERFETVRVKEKALEILRNELARKAKTGVVATGAMSDPYNPAEKGLEVTRNALALLHAYGFGAAIATKSDLICRDADILRDIAAQAPVLCKVTITCWEDSLAQKLEPAAPSPTRRFAALEKLSRQGIFCGVLLMPVLPYIEDTKENVLEILKRAGDAGARFVYPSFGVTMRAGQREYLLQKLDAAFPGMGQRYSQRFGSRYFCSSPRAKALWEAFQEGCAKTGMLCDMQDIVAAYRQGYGCTQLSLFDTL